MQVRQDQWHGWQIGLLVKSSKNRVGQSHVPSGEGLSILVD